MVTETRCERCWCPEVGRGHVVCTQPISDRCSLRHLSCVDYVVDPNTCCRTCPRGLQCLRIIRCVTNTYSSRTCAIAYLSIIKLCLHHQMNGKTYAPISVKYPSSQDFCIKYDIAFNGCLLIGTMTFDRI